MTKNIQSIRGMNDCLPVDIQLWQKIEYQLKQILTSYGFSEIRTPLVEQTTLFSRAIGEVTDVVEKEMYSFNDRNGNALTLRPENTAGCVRAAIEHGLLYNQQQRFWYLGPMFRYERPQRGRYRQFHQLGVEVFGLDGPDIDAELIIMTLRWWVELGVTQYVSLELNSIGSLTARVKYRQALVSYLRQHENKLDDDCKSRLLINPLRILDSKNPDVQKLLNDAPLLSDYLDSDSKQHFFGLCKLLDAVGVQYKINQRLVRGLDYYNRTVFEWVTNALGVRSTTICAGGRYDGLVEQLGGRATSAVGFAMGMERIVLLVRQFNPDFIAERTLADVYLIRCSGLSQQAILLAEKIRDQLPTLKLMTHHGGGNVKKQLAQADKYRAKIAIILGKNEFQFGEIIIKDLRNRKQEKIPQQDIVVRLSELLA